MPAVLKLGYRYPRVPHRECTGTPQGIRDYCAALCRKLMCFGKYFGKYAYINTFFANWKNLVSNRMNTYCIIDKKVIYVSNIWLYTSSALNILHWKLKHCKDIFHTFIILILMQ